MTHAITDSETGGLLGEGATETAGQQFSIVFAIVAFLCADLWLFLYAMMTDPR
jgi:hypothetical protein